jgi:hypothetical protein
MKKVPEHDHLEGLRIFFLIAEYLMDVRCSHSGTVVSISVVRGDFENWLLVLGFSSSSSLSDVSSEMTSSSLELSSSFRLK